jgi:hypothetical protein
MSSIPVKKKSLKKKAHRTKAPGMDGLLTRKENSFRGSR